jgi:hypothetical protein
MSGESPTMRPATLGVALISLSMVCIGACRSSPGRGAVAETAGARPAPPASTTVSVPRAPARAAAPSPRPPETFAMRAPPGGEQDMRGQGSPQQGADTSRARYPKTWEVAVPPGTRLDTLRRVMDTQFGILPPQDLEDRSPLPIWFRVYLRKRNPDLPTHGPYQYPRTARRLLQWMVAHPDSVER